MANQTENSRLVGILEKIAVGAISLIVVWQYNAIQKLEERVDRIQTSSFTVESARLLEDRLTKYIDGIRADVRNETKSIREDMNSKLDLLIKIQTEKK
jgi:hypothetical protein